MTHRFESPRTHGFVSVAVGLPRIRIADPHHNARQVSGLLRQAADADVDVVVFPELCLSGYSIDDLVQQDACLDACVEAVDVVRSVSRGLPTLCAVGAPLRFGDGLFDCAVVLHDGAVLGVVPKSYLPNYREFYEKRVYSAARDAPFRSVRLLGAQVPFGNDLLFGSHAVPELVVHLEVCEDLWVPIPPSTWAALGGATVLANLSASNATTGKSDYRELLCAAHSARCLAAQLYVSAGPGESTTDLAWDGDALVCENGIVLARSRTFVDVEQLVVTDVDVERLRRERMRTTSFQDQVGDHAEHAGALRRVAFGTAGPARARPLRRDVPRFPYVPAGVEDRDKRCREVVEMQVNGLRRRLEATGIERVVIGVSGGLDSTLALLVAAATVDRMSLPRSNVLAYHLPGFATGDATTARAHSLTEALGVTSSEIDIRPSSMQMLRDLDHPYAHGEPVYDTTFENVQAGERTSLLFRLANQHGALVLGTGDLSELALGWCTYGVGDQMSHYDVNASVPKTLIRYLLRWSSVGTDVSGAVAEVLVSVLDNVITPELIPADASTAQDTEKAIGPFELHDFFLYHLIRFGMRPSKIAYLAHQAWGDAGRGSWPDLVPEDMRHEYDLAAIKTWLRVFLERFLRNQFKRSASPNAPKVGSGGSLSPRGDWRAPSDVGTVAWIDELNRLVPD